MNTSIANTIEACLRPRLSRWLPALLIAGLGGAEAYTRSEAARLAEKWADARPSARAFQPVLPAAGPDTLVESLDQVWDAATGEWVTQSRIRYQYQDDRLVRAVAEIYDGQAWTSDSQNVYTYDSQGRMIEDRIERWSGGWTVTKRLQFSYDAAGRVVKTVVQGYASGNWNNLTQELTAYRRTGGDSLVLHQLWEAGAWVDESRVLTQAGGLTMTQTTQVWNFGARTWSNTQRAVYTYGNNGYLENIVEQSWAEPAWTNSVLLEYKIKAGKIVDVTVKEWADAAWVNAYYFRPTYQAGRQVEDLYQVWTDGAWVNDSRTRNVYDIPTPVAIRAASFPGIRRLPAPSAEVRFGLPFDAASFRADGKRLALPFRSP